jgi:hypothetical protein
MKKIVMMMSTMLVVLGLAPSAGAVAKLSGELLTLGQLPKGYVSASSGTIVPGCNTSSLGAAPTAQASASFDFGTLEGWPQVAEGLATYKNVKAAFTSLSSALKGCAHVTGTKKGTPYTVTIAPMTFSPYGDQSAAYTLTVSFSDTSQSGDLIVVRKGDVLLQLTDVNSGSSIGKSAFTSVTKAAVDRL